MRRFDLTRTRLLKILAKIADEGWIERLPGNGWAFGPLLTSRESYQHGYQLRAALEPQALLLPGFAIDRQAFAAARERQQWLLDGAYKRASRSEIFAANSEFHEMLMNCAGNPFFLDAVKRVNRLRRLIEYRITVDRSRLPIQCREHITILTLLEKGLRQEAADFLRVHVFPLEAKNGATRHNAQTTKLREAADEGLGDAIAQIFRTWGITGIEERQNSYRIYRLPQLSHSSDEAVTSPRDRLNERGVLTQGLAQEEDIVR